MSTAGREPEAAAPLGSGARIFAHPPVRGPWLRLRQPLDVLDAAGGAAAGAVAVVDDAGATFLAPVLHELAALICTAGSTRSHVAIVSREFGLPALMGATLSAEPLPGTLVEVDCSDDPGVVRTVMS